MNRNFVDVAQNSFGTTRRGRNFQSVAVQSGRTLCLNAIHICVKGNSRIKYENAFFFINSLERMAALVVMITFVVAQCSRFGDLWKKCRSSGTQN